MSDFAFRNANESVNTAEYQRGYTDAANGRLFGVPVAYNCEAYQRYMEGFLQGEYDTAKHRYTMADAEADGAFAHWEQALRTISDVVPDWQAWEDAYDSGELQHGLDEYGYC